MLRPRHRVLCWVLFALTSVTLSAQSAGDRVNVLISFTNAPGNADEALVRGAGGEVRHRFHLVTAVAARVPAAALAALRANPGDDGLHRPGDSVRGA